MFQDREDAGKRLAEALAESGITFDLVLGIPRGGVVVAHQIADYFQCPLDVVMARKIGSPTNLEYAVGAVTPDGEILLEERLREYLGIDEETIELSARRVHQEINQRLSKYRSGKEEEPLAGRRILLVDDGIATGFTIKAAVAYLRRRGAAYIAVAVPVTAPEAYEGLKDSVDGFFSLMMPEAFYAVGQFYRDFSPTDDSEVIKLLK